MRGVAFIKQLMLSFPGNHYSHALCLADVDNDQANELVIGNVSGALQVFKGSDAKAWRTAGNLGTITALACGPVLNNGKNVVLVCSMEGKCHLLDFSTLDQPQSRENRGEGDQRKPVQKGDTVCRPFHEQHLSFNISSVLVSKFISGQHLVVVGRTDRAFTVYQWQEQQQQQSKDESRSVEARGHLVQLYSHSMSGQISSLSSTGLINGGIRSLLLSQPGGIMVPVVIGGEIPGVREAAIEKTDSASREVSPVPDDNLPKQQQPQQQQKSQEHKHQQPESPQPPEQPQQSKEQQQQQHFSTASLVQIEEGEATPGPLNIGLATAIGALDGFSYVIVPAQSDASYFVMSADGGEIRNYFHREFNVQDGSSIRSETPDTSTVTQTSDRNPMRSYVAGITVGNYSYFVAGDEHASGVNRVRVIRICDGDSWDNWYEINLICGSATASLDTVNNTLIDANFVTQPNGMNVLFWTVNDGSNARTCSVGLAMLDDRASNVLSECTTVSGAPTSFSFPWGVNSGQCGGVATISECDLSNNDDGPFRLSTELTDTGNRAPIQVEDYSLMFAGSSTTTALVFYVEGWVVVFAGFSNGVVSRYVLETANGSASAASAVDKSWTIAESTGVVDLARGDGSNYLFAITLSTVFRLTVEECSTYTDCSSCATSGGRLCGWCTVESKCSRTSQCSNSAAAGRWVNQADKCLVPTVTTTPGQPQDYPRTTTSIPITVTNLPSVLEGETFSCFLSGVGAGTLVAGTGDSYNCVLSAIPAFQADGPDTIVSTFSLRSSQNPEVDFGIVENAFNIYDCNVPTTCSSCAGRYTCQWCYTNSSCLDTGNSCPVGSVKTSAASCPKIRPSSNPDGKYYLHETPTVSSLTLNGMSLDVANTPNQYFCSYLSGNTEVQLTAVRETETQMRCNIPMPSLISLPPGTSELEVDVNIQFGSGGTDVTVLDSDQPVKLVLYNCGKLADRECSGCLQLNTQFGCQYCMLLSSCFLPGPSRTCSQPPIMAGEFGMCGNPSIQRLSPSSGPLQGGTRVNFTGMNLGQHTFTFDGVACTDQVEVTPGSVSSCVAPARVTPGAVEVRVLRGSFNERAGEFRYADPVVTNFSPQRGPTGGGTLVTVTGSDLAVGDVSRTSVSVAGRMCSGISFLSSAAITCTTVSGSVDTGPVTMNVDGYVASATSNAAFSYLQPSVTGIFGDGNDGTIIQSGGVYLNFTGQNLDVWQTAVLTVTQGAVSAVTMECTAASSTMLVCQLPRLNFAAGMQLQYSLSLDGTVLGALAQMEPLTVVENPRFDNVTDLAYTIDSGSTISLAGSNLDHVRQENYRVTVGSGQCVVLLATNSSLVCRPPQSSSGTSTITVYFGQSADAAKQVIGALVYASPPYDSTPAVVAGVVVGLLVVVVVVAVILGLILGTWFVKTRTDRQVLEKPLSREQQRVVLSDFESVHLRFQAQKRHSDLQSLLQAQREDGDLDPDAALDDRLTQFDQPLTEEPEPVPDFASRPAHRSSSRRAYANELFQNMPPNPIVQPSTVDEDKNLIDDDDDDDDIDANVVDDDGDYNVDDDDDDDDDDDRDSNDGGEEDQNEAAMPKKGGTSGGYGQGEDVYEEYSDDDYDEFMTTI